MSAAGPCARPALSLLDHLLVEVPLQPLVGQIDEELLEAVVLETLEAVDVEKTDRAPAAEVVGAAGARTVDVEGGVHSSDDPFEESRVDGASEGIPHVSRLLRRQRAHDRVRGGGGGGGAVDGSVLLGRRRHLWRRLGRAAGAARAEAQRVTERRRRHLQRSGTEQNHDVSEHHPECGVRGFVHVSSRSSVDGHRDCPHRRRPAVDTTPWRNDGSCHAVPS